MPEIIIKGKSSNIKFTRMGKMATAAIGTIDIAFKIDSGFMDFLKKKKFYGKQRINASWTDSAVSIELTKSGFESAKVEIPAANMPELVSFFNDVKESNMSKLIQDPKSIIQEAFNPSAVTEANEIKFKQIGGSVTFELNKGKLYITVRNNNDNLAGAITKPRDLAAVLLKKAATAQLMKGLSVTWKKKELAFLDSGKNVMQTMPEADTKKLTSFINSLYMDNKITENKKKVNEANKLAIKTQYGMVTFERNGSAVSVTVKDPARSCTQKLDVNMFKTFLNKEDPRYPYNGPGLTVVVEWKRSGGMMFTVAEDREVTVQEVKPNDIQLIFNFFLAAVSKV